MAVKFSAPGVSIRGGIARKGRGVRFAAEYTEWAMKTKKRLDFVHRLATFRLAQTMQKTVHEGGWLPFREGYLRASFTVTVNARAPSANKRKINSSKNYNEGVVKEQIYATSAGDRVVLSYRMNYARVLEYTGHHMGYVMRSAQMWPVILRQAVAEAKATIR